MPKFGVKEVADVVLWDILTGKPSLFLDSLKLSNLENAADTSYAQGGKGNARLLGWDYNRTATFSVQDALMNPKAVAMLAGSADVTTALQTVRHRDQVAVGAAKFTLTNKPKQVNARFFVYKVTAGVETEVTGATWSNTVGNDVTFSGTLAPNLATGDTVAVYYEFDTATTASTITISSNLFPGYYSLTGDTVVRNASTGLDEPFKILIPKAKLGSNFTISLTADGDPSVFDMALDVFPNDTKQMVQLVKY